MTRHIILVDIGNSLMLTGVLPSAALHNAYSARVSARNGVAPYTYSVVSGSLPPGLSLDAGTGILSGADLTAAGAFAFTVRATDLSGATVERQFALTVIAEPLTLSGHVPDGTVGVPTTYTYAANGGIPPRTYSVIGAPDGITMPDSSVPTLSVNPTTGGIHTWTMRATDSDGAVFDLPDSAMFTAVVAELTLAGTFAGAMIDVSYTSELTISGGDDGYSNPRITVGALPVWATLSIVGNKLRLSGTPTGSTTTFNFTAAVDSGDGQTATSAQSVVVVANPHFDKIVYQHNMAGANGSTVFTDVQGKTWTTRGNAHIDTSRGYNVAALDGTGDYLEALFPVGTDSITLQGKFTIDAWIIPPASGSIRAICSHRPNTGQAGWVFWVRDNGQLGFAYSGGDTGIIWADITSGSITLTPGALTHVEVGFDGAALRTFVGGNLSAKVTTFGSLKTAASSTTPAYIGRDRVGNTTRDWLPAIKAVRVYSGACMHPADTSFTPEPAPWPTA